MHFFKYFSSYYAIALTFIDFLVFIRYADRLAVEFDLRLYTVLKKFIEFRKIVPNVFYDLVQFFDAVGLHFSEQLLHVRLVLNGLPVEAVEKMGFVSLQKKISRVSVWKSARCENLLCHLRSRCVSRLPLWE